ncbi:catalase-peroxidase [Palleronia salina]|uniref:Catalase-peroxidase n=1 Tax=Palleronia salina TaxID=313368 RepID=A0A1M6GAF4_9RHOB|nr:catalase/peroxidase HPI [Palleronia salina]SHJ06847.1 catalase-peroxidase [Palleronia salina]
MKDSVETPGTCPFRGTRIGGAQGSKPTLQDWYPARLRTELLHLHSAEANPQDPDFNYAEAFAKLDLDAIKADIRALMTDSQDNFWPADYGHYGPQMIRMAWHAAGTYRIADGRGGAATAMQRFAPVSSWADNGNTDKSRRLLWPIKQKYGAALSWADLMILTGNVALESMGFETVGFGGGREDAWVADDATYWGPETEIQGRDRWEGDPSGEHYDLENPVGASEMMLIYVNPEGPGGSADPMESAREIRETFARMAMNDEETVALIAGGHAFGKSHGGSDPDGVGPAPEAAPIHAQSLGWMNSSGKGFAEHTMTNGIEGSWVSNPIKWDHEYLHSLMKYDWELIVNETTGAQQWKPKDPDAIKTPDAHREGVEHPLMMMTSDIALKQDPAYRKIVEKFIDQPETFDKAFAEAWYKLTHRDMGPINRLIGKEVPSEPRMFQDPIPDCDHPVIDDGDIASLKSKILETGLGIDALVGAAWASASTFRHSDNRGGANGARVRLAPQKDWEVNNPESLYKVLSALEGIQSEFNDSASGGKRVSLADLIVLAGCAAVEKAAREGGIDIAVPFTPGRMDASDEETDAESFEWLRPVADGFRNYQLNKFSRVTPEQMLLDRAELLTLSAPELTALVGGLRVLGANWDGGSDGVLTDRPGTLSNDFFVNLTDFSLEWLPVDADEQRFEARKRGGDAAVVWTGTRADLIFGHNAQLRQVTEFYAGSDANEKFVRDFVAAWNKVMMLDRFDVKH